MEQKQTEWQFQVKVAGFGIDFMLSVDSPEEARNWKARLIRAVDGTWPGPVPLRRRSQEWFVNPAHIQAWTCYEVSPVPDSAPVSRDMRDMYYPD